MTNLTQYSLVLLKLVFFVLELLRSLQVYRISLQGCLVWEKAANFVDKQLPKHCPQKIADVNSSHFGGLKKNWLEILFW